MNKPALKHPQYNSSKNNVRSSQIFYNIADQDMTQFVMNYIEQETNEDDNNQKQQHDIEHVEKLEEQYREDIKIEEEKKQAVSRLEIQIEKNGLQFVPVYGEIFILLIRTRLIGQQKKNQGKLLLTNYRIAFFKDRCKKLDLPFGFISQTKLNDKAQQIALELKTNHCWKIQIIQNKDYNHLKIFEQIYSKIQSMKSFFAFSYALKCPNFSKFKHPQAINELIRLGFSQYKSICLIENHDFSICRSYPQILYIPQKMKQRNIAKIAKYWNLYRLPTITYIQSSHSKIYGEIWRSSALMCDRNENLDEVKRYLKCIRNEVNILIVFDAGFKNLKKGLQQYEIDSNCEMKYLETFPLQNIKASYLSIIQCFLNSKKTFIKDLLASKWYEGVLQFLRGAFQISKRLSSETHVLIKCQNGRDRSAVLSALTQIIINPYYRTYNGFALLVQKQFQFYGHPFRSRLGFNNEIQEQIPIFIMFLDCVTQLIHSNQMCFQYNFKYLSKLSNLMYTCCFGTFLANSRRQAIENHLHLETVPIWEQLISELTQNPFYQQKSGILQIPTKFDDIRIWKQHFWYLTTPPKQTYKIHPLAEDNLDYIGLNCLKIKIQNRNLHEQIDKQKIIIQSLKQKIKLKQQQIQNTK